MRPINKLTIPILCAAAVWNCSDSASENETGMSVNVENARVALKLQHPETPLVDSLVLDCYGADTLHLVHPFSESSSDIFSLDLFPSDHWNFKAKLYANGNLMQMGELETKLTAGSTVSLSIQMHAINGFVYIEVPLGLNNSAGVASGQMKLASEQDSYTISMIQTATAGVFKSGSLKLGANYDVELSLFDVSGKEIYKLTDKFLLTEDSPVPNLSLNSLRAQVSLGISFATEKNVELTIPLPATKRKPKAEDLLITEVMAAPDPKDSTQYEFVELYNGSLDTLILDECTIGLSGSNSTKYFPITAGAIPPNKVLVLGSTNSPNTPTDFIGTEGWNDLGNSKGSVMLKCGNILLDSLYYAPETDSIHTNVVPGIASGKYSLSSQLKMESWQNRKDSTAWILGAPTPGRT